MITTEATPAMPTVPTDVTTTPLVWPTRPDRARARCFKHFAKGEKPFTLTRRQCGGICRKSISRYYREWLKLEAEREHERQQAEAAQVHHIGGMRVTVTRHVKRRRK